MATPSPRPTFIDLTESRNQSAASSRFDRSSPRIQHFDGDIPPALSPLDAFAAHSRRLARELDETRRAGERRLSRLPPQHIIQSLDQHQKNRPNIFRQLSNDEPVPEIPAPFRPDYGANPHVTDPIERPASSYPRHSEVPNLRDMIQNGVGSMEEEDEEDNTPLVEKDYFGAQVASSPRSLSRQNSDLRSYQDHSLSRDASSASHPDLTFTLAPPNAAFARKPYHESSDDDYTSSTAGSTFSNNRKLSSSSGVSVPQSPTTPYQPSHDRSPSLHSNNSATVSPRKPSNFNFSRPMSSASLTNLRVPTSPTSLTDRRVSGILSGFPESAHPFDDTRSIQSDGFIGESSQYTHTKWTLPRGRKSDRTSHLFRGISAPFEFQEPMFPGTPPLEARSSADLPTVEPLGKSSTDSTSRSPFIFGFKHARRPSSSDGIARSHAGLQNAVRPSTGLPSPHLRPPPVPIEEVSQSSRSTSTVRPSTSRTVSNYQDLTPDEHVTKAIDLHQNGELQKSTYHLRIAARQDHPTAMLLYALACRHGWGMRPNQKEGAVWLRKAVDHAMLEVADDEDPRSARPKVDAAEMKAHKNQFALAIYEVGQCHLNGWGMDQDKALALRCFEIAGSWGDVDALSEAGFCYAEGIGCKKNLKKAAKFYRMAESKGVSMVGNSWIHKDKYNDDNEEDDRKARSGSKTSAEGKRSKSKTRSIFQRKRTGT